MRCTAKKTFEAAAKAGVDLIVQVKGNQPTLHQHIQLIAVTTAPLGFACSHDKGRNRDARGARHPGRTVTVFDPADGLTKTGWQPHVAAVIRVRPIRPKVGRTDKAGQTEVEREVYTRNAATGLLRHTAETAFYVANAPLTATRAAEAIRAHWRIETTSHHSRDVTLGEDHSRIRTNPGVFARLRSFAFNILKANRTNTLSHDRYRAALADIDNLLSLVTSQQR